MKAIVVINSSLPSVATVTTMCVEEVAIVNQWLVLVIIISDRISTKAIAL